MSDAKDDAKRLRCALGIIINNLEGGGFDAYKPISISFANQLAEFARAAYFGEPDERLDAALERFEQ